MLLWLAASLALADPCAWNDGVDTCRAECKAGSEESCRKLGYLLETGVGVPQPPAKPDPDHHKFEHEWPFEGEIYHPEPDRVRDLSGAIAAYQRGCDLKSPDACLSAGVLLRLEGPEHDKPRALALFAKAFAGWEAGCAKGNGNYCELMGSAWVGNWDHAQDSKQSERYFGLACQHGDGRGCWQFASFAPDKAARETLYKKSCDELDTLVGCLALKTWFSPEGTRPDPKQHAHYAERCCSLDRGFCGSDPF